MAAAAQRKSSQEPRRRSARQQDLSTESAPTTPAPSKSKKTASNAKKRSRTPVKDEGDELPHNLGGLPTPPIDHSRSPARKKKASAGEMNIVKQDPEEIEKVAQKAGLVTESPSKSSSAKAKPGRRSRPPGTSPYPNWAHPTADECHEVVRLLEAVHGKVQKPKTFATPSLTTAGCGAVPSVLDALIRTRLSAATTNKNSSTAFKGLVDTFGVVKEGHGKGSVDWNKVRLADKSEVFEAIKSGGLANHKSRDIKEILDWVYSENQQRAAALKHESGDPAGAENEAQGEKQDEMDKADKDVISLDYLHLLSDEEAFETMVALPGIGPKTASCVLLFCLQRDSFAVDTHVFRLCKYLGWVPPDDQVEAGQPRVNRETCFAHCEVRVPPQLKYALHQLLIKHGKTCPRCRAATGMGNERWAEGCPIESLVKRHGAKKGGATPSPVKVQPKSKKRKSQEMELAEDMESANETVVTEPSDIGSDDDD